VLPSAAWLDWLGRNLRLLGVVSILLGVGTWVLDLGGWVHPCVYCRTQRTAIALVGILMALPHPRHWISRYLSAVICFFGANISVAQLFLIVRSINDGKDFGGLNLFMASGALFTLTGQALLLFMSDPDREREPGR
jgi:disulfide bond formation protein DsbB